MTFREFIVEKARTLIPRQLTAKEIALSGVMAAVMAVAAFIPVTVVAGVGKVISAAVMLEPFIGVMLGPVLGMYAAAAGAFVGQILAPHGAIFGLLTFIPPTVGATTAGLLAYKRWKAAITVMGVVLLLWYSTGIGRQLYYYPYMCFIFVGFVLLFRGHLSEWIHVKYDEIIGVKGAGIWVLMGGLLLVLAAQIALFASVTEIYIVGIGCSIAAFLLFAAKLTVPKVSVRAAFVIAGIVLIVGALPYGLFTTGVTILLGITFFLFAVVLKDRQYSTAFLGAFILFGAAAAVYMIITLENNGFLQSLTERVSYMLIIVGLILVCFVHFRDKPVKKWAGFTLVLAGGAGLIQRFLLFASESQTIKRELMQMELPYITDILGRDITITTAIEYYLKKVFPVYAGHLGWFLIFVALIVLGVSLFLNISLEKLAVAYFVMAGFAVLSDLMIGNFLAIQVLELNAGIFKAFLFIYPVERMFMAFFATIFGVGVIVSLKKYGITNMIRR
jgi:hypothetical protein